MCLGIPGEIVTPPTGDLRMARVSFAGVVKEVSLIYLPDAGVGDFVLVHAGFAISDLDAEEAHATLALFEEAEQFLSAN